ncbi:hypothetical protein B4915_04180 [Leucobacter massiliensis]|uniref:Helix-hairpin-helix DNA-binding motif class 1 domain-containing protein n=2 Tax=Leucobacter massiliensis TaxID=1686285 RepID=A0A2S9QRV0_9MICO|nr:hypothetical protein B4915_04180 [Leucobacter massiliensis]
MLETEGAPAAEQDADPSGGPTADGAAGGGELLVHVVGEVSLPGVVELPAGSRVADAIEAAGGASDAAVLSAVNLARVLVDGEQLLVPNAEQIAAGAGAAGGAGAAAGAPSAVGSAAGGVAGGLVDLNAADAATLETLPRVGPALAQRIIDWREANGGFASVEQLMEVSGIGAKTFEGLAGQVTV